MRPTSPGAFMLSLTLHGLIIAVALLISFALQTEVRKSPKIFELVAGEGDNYNATEAPALGVPGGIKLQVPVPPAPVPATPEPAAAPPEPVVEQKIVEKAPAKVVEPKPPNFSKDVKRIADKREKRLVEADRKKREAEAKRISKAEFDKLNKGRTAQKAGGASTKVARIDAEGIARGVVGGSTNNKTGGAGGKALSRDEQDALDSYIALLLLRLRAAHEKPPGLSDLLQARVEFRVAADGTLSAVKIIDSSGSADFDRSVLEAFTRVRSIGPTPNGKSDVWVVTFKMKEED